MTYLELCQLAASEMGNTSGGPAGVTNQIGELGRIVEWISRAYVRIQRRHRGQWKWLRRNWTLNTDDQQILYAPSACTDVDAATTIERFAQWRIDDPLDPPKIYLSSAGVGTENWLTYMPWEHFKMIYKRGTQQSGYPAHITADPQNNLHFGMLPNDVYAVSGVFQRSAQTLAQDDDVPEMPEDFHEVIVLDAMRMYAGAEAAQEIMNRAVLEGRPTIRDLELDQLDRHMRLAGPMA